MCDVCSKFEKDRTKTVVAIVDEPYCGHADRQTGRQTYTQVIVNLTNAMHDIGQTIAEHQRCTCGCG